jgi:hypothetical protein
MTINLAPRHGAKEDAAPIAYRPSPIAGSTALGAAR